MPDRYQIEYPLDAESLATLKAGLPNVLKELEREQGITLKSGDVSFDVRGTDAMNVAASAGVTIATITNGYSGQILTLRFADANVTITDSAAGTTGTINLNGAFTSAVNVILQLYHNGTSWLEIDRSTADVGGPATSTDNAIARWDGTTGVLLQDSVVLVGDTGNVTGLGTLNTHTLQGGTSTLAMYSNNLSVFAATTSAQLAGVITNETGSGSLVFGIDPTLTRPIITFFIADINSNEMVEFITTALAVNNIRVDNNSSGNNPQIIAQGDDANVGLNFGVKGTGVYQFTATASQSTEIRLFEDTDNGVNYIALTLAAALSANLTLTLPSATDTLVGKATTDIFTNKSMSEAQLTFTDITTGNASTTAHGFAPKRDGLTTTFLRGDGTYAVPNDLVQLITAAEAHLITGEATKDIRVITPIVIYIDAVATRRSLWSCKVPKTATSIGSIKLLYYSAGTGNLRLRFDTTILAIGSTGANPTSDITDTFAAYVGNAAITVPTGAYNGLTIAADNLFTISVERESNHVNDTYNAQWDVFGVEVTFA